VDGEGAAYRIGWRRFRLAGARTAEETEEPEVRFLRRCALTFVTSSPRRRTTLRIHGRDARFFAACLYWDPQPDPGARPLAVPPDRQSSTAP